MSQLCTHNRSWAMDIVISNKYCILCSIALMQVKLKKLPKSCCTSFIIICLITLNEILTCGKSRLSTHNQSWDMDILKSDCYYLLCL